MGTLRFYIPEQTFEFDIDDPAALVGFSQALAEDEAGDPYALMEMADVWTSDVHSAIDIEIEYEE